MKLTLGNSTAIVVGLISIAPQIQAVVTQGIAAFEGCKTLIVPVFTAGGLLLSTVIALFSEKVKK
jgi:hypothetical protein